VFPQITFTQVGSSLSADSIRKQAAGRCIFGLLGVLHPRKDLRMFLRIAAEADSDKSFFVLAGKFDAAEYPPTERAEILQLLDTNGRDNCFFLLTHIDNPLEFNALVDCCDVLYLVYRGHFHSSGLLAKAAQFRKPVIVSRGYRMGEQAEKYKLGITVNDGDYAEVFAAVQSISEPDVRKTLLLSADFAEYCRQNDADVLKQALQQLMKPVE
jgi:glycosyltransferase involved in cell wall biosynthesis